MKKLLAVMFLILLMVTSSYASTIQEIDSKNIGSIVLIEGRIVFYDSKGSVADGLMWSGSGWVKSCKYDSSKGRYRLEIGTAWHVLDINLFYNTVTFGSMKLTQNNYSVVFTLIYHDGTKQVIKNKDIEGYYIATPDYGYIVAYSNTPRTTVKLANSPTPKRGDRIIALTCPYGLPFVLTDGIIASDKMPIPIDVHNVYRDLYIVTAQLAPGSSGGAIFNIDGELIGFCDAGMQEGAGASYGLIVSLDFLNSSSLRYERVPIILKNSFGKVKDSSLILNYCKVKRGIFSEN